MYWLEISVQTDGEGAEAVAEMLRPFAYQESVVLEQRGDETNLDPEALEPGVAVKIYVPEDDDTPELRRHIEEVLYHLGRLYPLPPPVFRELRDEDWANAWKEHYRPFRLGRRLRIRPTWLAGEPDDDARPDDVTLVLDPGMAFGTGLHPTTQSCLRALEDLVQPGMTVLDAGTGSGILPSPPPGWGRRLSPPLTPTRWPCGLPRRTRRRTAWPSAFTSGAVNWTARRPRPGRRRGTSSWPTFWPRSSFGCWVKAGCWALWPLTAT